MEKYFVFHCNNRSGNYSFILSGRSQSEAIAKDARAKDHYAHNGTCISECDTLEKAEKARPRIR